MGRFLAGLVILAALAGAGWHFRQDIDAWIRPLAASGPPLASIAEIVAAPQRFDGREVTVTGTVWSTSEVSFAGGAPSRNYTLREGRAEIVVASGRALPPRGQTLQVTGKVSRPPGAGLAPRLAETRREAAR